MLTKVTDLPSVLTEVDSLKVLETSAVDLSKLGNLVSCEPVKNSDHAKSKYLLWKMLILWQKQ